MIVYRGNEVTGETVTIVELAAEVRDMRASLDAILTKIDSVTAELSPMIDGLSSSPMFKMLMPKGLKK